ncbi:hypothetical protein AB595_02730 [Massilia sp. WF1]|nr:hypothetical protein AB595_02730 [Massilia sp. WF1]
MHDPCEGGEVGRFALFGAVRRQFGGQQQGFAVVVEDDRIGRDRPVRHMHRVLQLERLQELAKDLAAPDLVDLHRIVFDDVPDGAAFEVLLRGSGSECAGHFANLYL